MQALKIGVSRLCPDCFSTDRTTINIHESDYIDIAAAVMTVSDIYLGLIDEIEMTGFGIPVFVVCQPEERVPAEYLPRVAGVFEDSETYREHYGRQLEAAAQKYETALRPPFFRALVDYVSQGNSAFDCPGHQGGDFFRRHPRGISSSVSSAIRYFAPICATLTWRWGFVNPRRRALPRAAARRSGV